MAETIQNDLFTVTSLLNRLNILWHIPVYFLLSDLGFDLFP